MSFGSEQVLRFLQRRDAGEVKDGPGGAGPDGVRVKHWFHDNSLKLYDKGSVLRSEVTINNPEGLPRVSNVGTQASRREELADSQSALWPMWPGGRKCAGRPPHRHLQALSVVRLKEPRSGRKPSGSAGPCARRDDAIAACALAEDAALLEAVNRLEFAVAEL